MESGQRDDSICGDARNGVGDPALSIADASTVLPGLAAARNLNLYEAIIRISRATLRATTREELCREICRAAVEQGGFLLAWVGWHDADRNMLLPFAECGDTGRYLPNLKIYTDDRPEGRGPGGIAFRTRAPYVCNDFFSDPCTALWHAEAARVGIRACAAFPIRVREEVTGALIVYAGQCNYFQREELSLLQEAAVDVSFALDRLDQNEERRRAEDALRASETRLQHAQEIAKVGSWDMEIPSGKLYWSEELYSIFGMDRSRAPDYDEFLMRVHPADRQMIIGSRRTVLAGTSGFDLTHRLVMDDGTLKYVHATGRLTWDVHGQPKSLTASVRDITAQKEAENALRDANAHLENRVDERTRELAVAKERAESADRLKSAFLATMSHELRTPLNSIIGFTGIVLQGMAGPLTSEQSHQLGMVRSSARHLLSLINDVLDISKIEAGQLEVRAAPFDVYVSMEKMVATMMPMASRKDLRLRLAAAPGLGVLESDQRRVEQVILNLVNNAIKFTERGEVELAVELLDSCALKRAADPEPCVRFRVTDTGIGIKECDLPHLFKAFHQIDTGLTRQHDGTGLGLAICSRLADLLGGEMSVQSRFGVGSEFCFTVPLRRQEPTR
jgi:PAS domain S-box-containing protein